MKIGWCAQIAAALVLAAVVGLDAETNSYRDDSYDFGSLKTFDFKTQRRLSQDPIANNRMWADEIKRDLTGDLQKNGFELDAKDRPDFLVAYYVGLKERYTTQVMNYGYPGFGGRWRYNWAWGWPANVDIWNVPYTDSTLIVDIIDAQTNQLVWRGYDTNTIDMKKPDKRLDKAVETLVKRFIKDTREDS